MRRLAIALLLAASLAYVPSASAAPCDGELAVEADCWVDYVQPHPNRVIDDAEDATGQDLGGVQVFVNWLIDRAQDEVRPVFDILPDHIPCVSPGGPHCW